MLSSRDGWTKTSEAASLAIASPHGEDVTYRTRALMDASASRRTPTPFSGLSRPTYATAGPPPRGAGRIEARRAVSSGPRMTLGETPSLAS